MSGLDILALFHWWLALFLLGIAAWPLALRLFSGLAPSFSYLPAKVLGLFLVSLIHWQAGYLLGWGLTFQSIVLMILVLGTVSWFISLTSRFRRTHSPIQIRLIGKAALFEAGFAFLLGLGAWLRTFKPALDSLEKFMNVAFINSILRSPGLPAADPWLSGSTINYYYFGHYTYALLTRLTGLATPIAYNLGMATLWAFGASLSLVLVAGMIWMAQTMTAIKNPGLPKSRLGTMLAPAAGGLLSLVLVNLAGNGHSFFYSSNSPGKPILIFLQSIGIDVGNFNQAYWFPNATRFIGYNPDTADKTIHEFPFYSYLVSDLHAHVINLTVVLFFLILLLSLTARSMKPLSSHALRPCEKWYQQLALPEIVTLGCCLAIFKMQNYWDFIIYLPVAAFIVTAIHFLNPEQNMLHSRWQRIFRLSLIQLALMIGLALLLALPFQAHFEPISSEIAFTEAHTPVWQWLVLWGPHVLAGSIGCLAMVISRKSRQEFQPVDALALGLFVYGLVLTIAPEIFYVVDIYTGEYKRANTMFKFTYQAFVLLGLSWSYWLVRLATSRSKKRFAAIFLALLLIIPGWFSLPALNQWYGERTQANQQSLDGLAPIGTKNSPQVAGESANELADDLLLINWLNAHVSGQPVILEAAGASYTDTGLISTFTGLPTVIGWETHEWLWRTSRKQPNAYGDLVKPRQDDVRLMYTTKDPQLRQDLFANYHVSYLVLGAIERTSYGQELQESMLLACGDVVFSTPTLQLIKLTEAGS